MIRHLDYYAQLIGRIFVGGYFLWRGILQTLDFGATVSGVGAALPQPVFFALIIIAIQVAGGIMLIVGSRVRPAALTLAIYMLISAFLFGSIGFANGNQAALFLKDMAIVGGLLFISTAVRY